MKKKMMKRALFLCLSCLVLIPWGCGKSELQTTFEKQENYIQSFITQATKADTTATVTVTEGVYRLIQHDTLDPRRDSLLWDGRVTLDYACYTLTSASVGASSLVATSVRSVATAAGWSLSDTTQFQAVTLTLDKSLVEGLRLGLYGVQPGDEGYILFNGKFGFGNRIQGTIPASSALAYHIWIESIENQ